MLFALAMQRHVACSLLQISKTQPRPKSRIRVPTASNCTVTETCDTEVRRSLERMRQREGKWQKEKRRHMSIHTSIAGDCACHELLKAEIAFTSGAQPDDLLLYLHKIEHLGEQLTQIASTETSISLHVQRIERPRCMLLHPVPLIISRSC
mmetsp:Transcript_13448/g.31873  ORF Transcript_13448/g.31873 Transcript_13448/m.31873 type:complete len:151 (-) Transcript_13448:1481-1933(-)